MSQYQKYETTAGLPSESVTFSRLLEHLRLAAECAYTIGHIKKMSADTELLGQGWLAVGELLEKMVTQCTSLATKGRLN